ncbi:WYL domain-containing protein [Streptomyces sp. NPDC002520]
MVQEAVFLDRRLRLSGRHSGGRGVRTYTAGPYGLAVKAGVRCLVAGRRSRPRLSRADRVHSARPPDDPVRRRDGVELAGVWEKVRRRVEERPEGGIDVMVRLRRERLGVFRRTAASRIAELPDGGGDGGGEGGTARLSYPVPRAARQPDGGG